MAYNVYVFMYVTCIYMPVINIYTLHACTHIYIICIYAMYQYT